MTFRGCFHQPPVQIRDPLYFRSEVQVGKSRRHMSNQVFSLLPYLEQSVEVRRDNLRYAALGRRNPLDQTVLTSKILDF
ncbi:hypothetical protein D3C80_1559550 [compost metagenome]